MNTGYRIKNNKGFTLVELIVSISIFAMMTALVVAKYGNFNQSVLLTNLAYDVALTIRTAQTYGVSVRQEGGDFTHPYGVFFSSDAGKNTQFTFFADTDIGSPGYYDVGDQIIKTYTLKRGAIIQTICMEFACKPEKNESELHVTFKRPNPDALICVPSSCGVSPETYAKIIIQGTDGSTRGVIVRSNGQIAVDD